MKTRKTILLSAIALLGAAAILQAVLSRTTEVKVLKLEAKPDAIEIVKAGGAPLTLAKDGDRWVAGEKKYPVAKSAADAMLAALESVRELGAVSSGGDYERYGLDDASRVVITARAGGRTLRTIYAGKNAATSQQSYALVDSGKGVVMVAGSLRGAFDKTLDDIRDREIWSVPAEGITRVDVDPDGKGGASYSIAKSGEPPAWSLVPGARPAKGSPDATLASNWVDALATLRADAFAPDGVNAQSLGTLASAKITAAGKVITLAIRAKDGDKRYLCTSSESPYPFYVSVPAAGKFQKPYGELVK